MMSPTFEGGVISPIPGHRYVRVGWHTVFLEGPPAARQCRKSSQRGGGGVRSRVDVLILSDWEPGGEELGLRAGDDPVVDGGGPTREDFDRGCVLIVTVIRTVDDRGTVARVLQVQIYCRDTIALQYLEESLCANKEKTSSKRGCEGRGTKGGCKTK
jgi:hypothetical protein